MEEINLRDLIKDYPDFPKQGIIFKDILPILANPESFAALIKKMASNDCIKRADALVGIDARGFIFASCIGYELSKPIILARKPGKLPGEIYTNSYSLEYGQNSLSIQKEALEEYQTYVIVDDLLATGGTIDSVSKILLSQDKQILGASVVVELSALKAREKLNLNIISQISY